MKEKRVGYLLSGIYFRRMVIMILLLSSLSFVSAGVGISWDTESITIIEETDICLTYKVYNPWDNDTYAEARLSSELSFIVDDKSSEVQFVPKLTSSDNAIPIEFCFSVPRVYERDCLIGDSLICKKNCYEEMEIYSGEVEVFELSEDYMKGFENSGSMTQMSVSAPLSINVQCISHDRDWSLIYLFIAIMSLVLLFFNILKIRKISRRELIEKSQKRFNVTRKRK